MGRSRMYIYVRSRQIEGTYPGSPSTGTWITTALRVMKGWGVPDESDWPYDGDADHWPPREPPDIDLLAKAHRVLAYQRANSVDECRALLGANHPVNVAIEIDASWREAPNGVIPVPSGQPVTGSHAVLLVGFDHNAKRFKFMNSWGTRWGDAGYGYLPYEYLSLRVLEGWTVTMAYVPPLKASADGIKLQSWGINDPLGGILHGIEIIDRATDDFIGWGFAVERNTFLCVEELFVRPNWRRRGYASQLTMEFAKLARRLDRRLCAWIPHSDVGPPNAAALASVLRQLGFRLKPSPVRWAAALATAVSNGGIGVRS